MNQMQRHTKANTHRRDVIQKGLRSTLNWEGDPQNVIQRAPKFISRGDCLIADGFRRLQRASAWSHRRYRDSIDQPHCLYGSGESVARQLSRPIASLFGREWISAGESEASIRRTAGQRFESKLRRNQ